MIQGINLIPDEIKKIKKAGQRRPIIIALLIFYAAGAGVFYVYQNAKVKARLAKIEQIKKERDELVSQSARYKEVIERINLAQRREGEIKKRLDVINSLLQARIYWSDILRAVTHLIPDGVWLRSMSTYDLAKGAGNVPAEPAGGLPSNASVRGKGIKFSGTAFSNSRIAEFIFAMENSQFAGSVALVFSQKREFQGRDLYDFEITADLKTAGSKQRAVGTLNN